MQPTQLIGTDGKLIRVLPDGRTVSYAINNLGKPGATAVATIHGGTTEQVDLTTTIRQLQQGNTNATLGPADSAFDPVVRLITAMVPEPEGYPYGGSVAAGTPIEYSGQIGDVSVPPTNELDRAFRTHDIDTWLNGHVELGTSVTLTTPLETKTYIVKDFWTVQGDAIQAVRRAIRDRALRALADAARNAVQGTVDLLNGAKRAIDNVLQTCVDNARESFRVAGETAAVAGRQILIDVVGVVVRVLEMVAKIMLMLYDLHLLTSPLPFATEQVFGELLSPASKPSSDSAGGKLAVRVSDFHECFMVTATVPHVGGAVSTGSGNIYIGGELAARLGDTLVCEGPPDTMCAGSGTVFWNGRPAVRVADGTVHGGKTVVGDSAVYVG